MCLPRRGNAAHAACASTRRDLLWFAIVGTTAHFLEESISRARYDALAGATAYSRVSFAGEMRSADAALRWGAAAWTAIALVVDAAGGARLYAGGPAGARLLASSAGARAHAGLRDAKR